MCSGYLYHVVCVFLLITIIQCKLDDNVILTYTNIDYINKVYSDGSTVVFGTFTTDNRMLDCDIRAVNGTVSANIFKEALTNKNTEADIQQMDIKRMTRQCKRFIRKMLRRKSNDPDSLVQQTKERLKIHVGYTGTSYCSTNPEAMVNRTVEVENKKINNCCKKLHTCKDHISPMEIKHKLFNHTPWSLYSCDCWKKFNNCIHQLPPSLFISTIETVLYRNIKSQCYTTDTIQTCDKWSEWFTVCDHKTAETVASIHFVSDVLK